MVVTDVDSEKLLKCGPNQHQPEFYLFYFYHRDSVQLQESEL